MRDFKSLGSVAYCTICNSVVKPSTVVLGPTVPSVTVGWDRVPWYWDLL